MACSLAKLTSPLITASSDKKLKIKQTKEEIFQYLRSKTTNEQYQRALNTIWKSSDSVIQAVLTIVKTFSDSAVKSVRVFVVIAAETFGAHLQILDKLNSQGPRVTPTKDLQQSHVILLFCPAATRVGASVDSAVKKIPGGAGSKAVVLILMHHNRDPEMVPNQTPWRDKFPRITHEVRVLYHQSKNGLLDCPMNQEAVRSLQRICDSFTDKTQEDGPTFDSSFEMIEEKEVDEVRSENVETEVSRDEERSETEEVLSSTLSFPCPSVLMGHEGSSPTGHSAPAQQSESDVDLNDQPQTYTEDKIDYENDYLPCYPM